MPGQYHTVLWRSKADEQWYARLVHPNGKTLMHAEGHKNRDDVAAMLHELPFPVFAVNEAGELVTEPPPG